MHGIAPTGQGSIEDPYVYVIPDGLTLTGSGSIYTDSDSVTFDLSGGTAGVSMATGTVFQMDAAGRLGPRHRLELLLGPPCGCLNKPMRRAAC
jgi:hypothetical protein